MTFPSVLASTRQERATVRYLNTVRETIQIASASELRYIWRQLKAPGFVWRVAIAARQDVTSAKSRAILRTVALFWSAGVRPATEEKIPSDVQVSLEQTAFLLLAHRTLRKQQLPTDVDRLWLFVHREAAIASCLKRHEVLAHSPFFEEGLKHVQQADSILYCAQEEERFTRAHKLVEYLEQFCLLPQDVDVSTKQLALWLHSKLVDQAQMKGEACFPFEWEGEMHVPTILDLYNNIYGLLSALSQGVTLDEAGVTASDLLKARTRLEAWLPKAMAAPAKHGVSREQLTSFTEQVMPMFNEVLKGEALFLVR